MNKTFSLFIMLIVMCVTILNASEPNTVKPSRPGEWWYQRHESKLKEIAKNKAKINLVWIGDSITNFMENRAPNILTEKFPYAFPLNLGYSADKTENVLWRLRNGEINGISPKLVIIMIGTNNTGHRKDPPNETALGIKTIVEEVCKRLPKSKILLLSIFPRGATPDDELRQINEEVNKLLPKMADSKKVFHLDINKYFLDEKGNLPKEVMPDMLHPNKRGYQIWMDAIKPTVDKLMRVKTVTYNRGVNIAKNGNVILCKRQDDKKVWASLPGFVAYTSNDAGRTLNKLPLSLCSKKKNK